MARQANLVMCDETIEHTFRFFKQTLKWTTRYEKRAANYLAMVTVAAILLWT